MKLCEFNKENLAVDVVGFTSYENVMNEPESLFIFQGQLCVPHPEYNRINAVNVFTNDKISITKYDVVTKVKLVQ